MARKVKAHISTLGSRLTSIVSVTLVLLILGILGMTAVASHSLTNDIRHNIGFIVKLDRSLGDTELSRIKRELSAAPFTESMAWTDAEEILRQESELMGQDLADLLDENPFGPEADIRVKPAWASGDSISAIAARIELLETVEEVVTETAVVDSINSVLSRTTLVLSGVALALIIISFVLINNTVSLAVYSRRFIIHTMKLVGATGAFIRRPFLLAGMGIGAIAAVLACGILAIAKAYSGRLDSMLDSMLSWGAMWCIFGALLIISLVICVTASALATNRYLRAQYDDMFR